MNGSIPSRYQLGFVLMIALVAVAAAEKVVLVDTLDPDAFWHLRVADQLVREGNHPLIDEIAYTSVRTP